MTKTHAGRARLLSVRIVIGGVASTSGLAAMLWRAIAAVRDGRGLETYRTVWLVEETWLGFLVFMGCALAALALAAAFRLREHLEWRNLEQRSRRNVPMSNRQDAP